jgi:hypothetical protein
MHRAGLNICAQEFFTYFRHAFYAVHLVWSQNCK